MTEDDPQLGGLDVFLHPENNGAGEAGGLWYVPAAPVPCGRLAPKWEGLAPQYCTLPMGHQGWHKSGVTVSWHERG